jgi:hypothetical protein
MKWLLILARGISIGHQVGNHGIIAFIFLWRWWMPSSSRISTFQRWCHFEYSVNAYSFSVISRDFAFAVIVQNYFPDLILAPLRILVSWPFIITLTKEQHLTNFEIFWICLDTSSAICFPECSFVHCIQCCCRFDIFFYHSTKSRTIQWCKVFSLSSDEFLFIFFIISISHFLLAMIHSGNITLISVWVT